MRQAPGRPEWLAAPAGSLDPEPGGGVSARSGGRLLTDLRDAGQGAPAIGNRQYSGKKTSSTLLLTQD